MRKAKVLIIGNSRTGKSSVVKRLVEDTFVEQHQQLKHEITVGADYARKDVRLDDDEVMRLQLWDLAGQDRFAVLVRPYYKDADAAVILCDLNSEDSIHAIRTWRNQLAEKFEEAMFPIVVFANKRDCLMDNGAKAGAELQKLCFELGICGWFMGSAKTGENVNECFEFIARAALKFVEKKKNDGLNEKQKAEENNLVELKLDDRIGERKDPFTGSSFQSCCFSM